MVVMVMVLQGAGGTSKDNDTHVKVLLGGGVHSHATHKSAHINITPCTYATTKSAIERAK